MDPHCIWIHGSTERYVPRPDEMRLNHYKGCRPNMNGGKLKEGMCKETEQCELDHSFHDRCAGALGGR